MRKGTRHRPESIIKMTGIHKPASYGMLGKKASQATKDIMSSSQTIRWQSNERREEQGRKVKARWANPEYKARLTQSGIDSWKVPDIRERRTEAIHAIIPQLSAHAAARRPEVKAKIILGRLNQVFPVKDTSIEVKLQNELKKAGISFITHKAITGQPDIYIPEKKLAVFADGCYWHGCPIHYPRKMQKSYHRDFIVKHNLELEGHNVVRLWEHEINSKDLGELLKKTKVII